MHFGCRRRRRRRRQVCLGLSAYVWYAYVCSLDDIEFVSARATFRYLCIEVVVVAAAQCFEQASHRTQPVWDKFIFALTPSSAAAADCVSVYLCNHSRERERAREKLQVIFISGAIYEPVSERVAYWQRYGQASARARARVFKLTLPGPREHMQTAAALWHKHPLSHRLLLRKRRLLSIGGHSAGLCSPAAPTDRQTGRQTDGQTD